MPATTACKAGQTERSYRGAANACAPPNAHHKRRPIQVRSALRDMKCRDATWRGFCGGRQEGRQSEYMHAAGIQVIPACTVCEVRVA